jgi:hypothetical protein
LAIECDFVPTAKSSAHAATAAAAAAVDDVADLLVFSINK